MSNCFTGANNLDCCVTVSVCFCLFEDEDASENDENDKFDLLTDQLIRITLVVEQ